MRNQINQIAKGLLDVFGVKQQGDHPRAYEEKLRLNFDMSFLQLQTNSERVFDNTLALAGAGVVGAGAYTLGGLAALEVPQGELWLILRARVMLELLGVGAVSAVPILGINMPGATGIANHIPITDGLMNNFGTNAGLATAIYISVPQALSKPFCVPSGARFIYGLQEDATGVAGGTIRFRSYIEFLRCKA